MASPKIIGDATQTIISYVKEIAKKCQNLIYLGMKKALRYAGSVLLSGIKDAVQSASLTKRSTIQEAINDAMSDAVRAVWKNLSKSINLVIEVAKIFLVTSIERTISTVMSDAQMIAKVSTNGIVDIDNINNAIGVAIHEPILVIKRNIEHYIHDISKSADEDFGNCIEAAILASQREIDEVIHHHKTQ